MDGAPVAPVDIQGAPRVSAVTRAVWRQLLRELCEEICAKLMEGFFVGRPQESYDAGVQLDRIIRQLKEDEERQKLEAQDFFEAQSCGETQW